MPCRLTRINDPTVEQSLIIYLTVAIDHLFQSGKRTDADKEIFLNSYILKGGNSFSRIPVESYRLPLHTTAAHDSCLHKVGDDV